MSQNIPPKPGPPPTPGTKEFAVWVKEMAAYNEARMKANGTITAPSAPIPEATVVQPPTSFGPGGLSSVQQALQQAAPQQAQQTVQAAQQGMQAVNGGIQAAEAVAQAAQSPAKALGAAGSVAQVLQNAVPAGAAQQALGVASQVAQVASQIASLAQPPRSKRDDVARVLERRQGSLIAFFDRNTQRHHFRLPELSFAFESAGDPGKHWHVASFSSTDSLLQPYRCELTLVSDNLSANWRKLRGQEASFLMHRDAMDRHVHGIVSRVRLEGTRGDRLIIKVEMVPAVALLAQRVNSRIFQNLSALEVVSRVLTEGLRPYARAISIEGVQKDRYPKAEFIVQYNESDLAFAQRLCEDAGISWWFKHDGTAETLCLVDSNNAFTELSLAYTREDIPVMGPEGDTADSESIRHAIIEESMQPTAVVMRDFDWTQPATDLTSDVSGVDELGRSREVFVYPADTTFSQYDRDAHVYRANDLANRTRQEHERIRELDVTLTGESNVTSLAAGHTFKLVGHAQTDYDIDYLVLSVNYSCEAPEVLTSDTHDAGTTTRPRCKNTFVAQPLAIPYRTARRTPRPRMLGDQTATVVGPTPPETAQSQDIFTDEHGRVKVQFHWDREGKRDHNASCWVRVQQTWGGQGWGTVFIPRVGMEVVVRFLNGNPDEPMIVGSVYNGTHKPPYTLPEHSTRSTIRTQSTPGNDPNKYNELRFEDALGSEEVFLHAQKDLNEVVLNDHSAMIGGSETVRVSGSQSTSVSGSRGVSVSHDQTTSIGGNQRQTITGAREVQVGGTEKTSVTGDRIVSVGQGNALFVDGTSTLEAKHQVTLKSEEGMLLQAPENITMVQGEVSFMLEQHSARLDAQRSITLRNDAGEIGLSTKETGGVSVRATKTLQLLCGESSITLHADGLIVLKGVKIESN